MSIIPVINSQTDLVITIGGRPIKSLPTTGVIAMMADIGPTSVWLAAMHGTGVFIPVPSQGMLFTVNVQQDSKDDAYLHDYASAIPFGAGPVAVVVKMGPKKYVSGNVMLQTRPEYTMTADGGLFSPWVFHGHFPIAIHAKWKAPTNYELPQN